MTEITVTLPDGSAREVRIGNHARRGRGRDRASASRRRRLAAKADGEWIDLDRPPTTT